MTTTCSCTWLLTQQESEINLSSPAKQFALHFFPMPGLALLGDSCKDVAVCRSTSLSSWAWEKNEEQIALLEKRD
jgi:hypothetical protein